MLISVINPTTTAGHRTAVNIAAGLTVAGALIAFIAGVVIAMSMQVLLLVTLRMRAVHTEAAAVM